MSLAIDLMTVRRLEELAFRGWPALETQDRAGWRLRFAGGYTKRANSINALGQNAQIDLWTLQGLEAAYRARNQAPVWRARSPRASMPGHGTTAPDLSICRSSPPTRRRCRSMPPKDSARLTRTNIVFRPRSEALALTLCQPPSIVA